MPLGQSNKNLELHDRDKIGTGQSSRIRETTFVLSLLGFNGTEEQILWQ